MGRGWWPSGKVEERIGFGNKMGLGFYKNKTKLRTSDVALRENRGKG